MRKEICYAENSWVNFTGFCESSRFSNDINYEYSKRKSIIRFEIQNEIKFNIIIVVTGRTLLYIIIIVYSKIQGPKLQ